MSADGGVSAVGMMPARERVDGSGVAHASIGTEQEQGTPGPGGGGGRVPDGGSEPTSHIDIRTLGDAAVVEAREEAAVVKAREEA